MITMDMVNRVTHNCHAVIYLTSYAIRLVEFKHLGVGAILNMRK